MEKWSSAQKTHIESSLTKAFAYSLTTAKDAESTLQIVKTFHWKGLIDISNVLHFFVFHGYRSCYRPLVDNPMPDCAKWESMPNVGSTYIDMNAFDISNRTVLMTAARQQAREGDRFECLQLLISLGARTSVKGGDHGLYTALGDYYHELLREVLENADAIFLYNLPVSPRPDVEALLMPAEGLSPFEADVRRMVIGEHDTEMQFRVAEGLPATADEVQAWKCEGRPYRFNIRPEFQWRQAVLRDFIKATNAAKKKVGNHAGAVAAVTAG